MSIDNRIRKLALRKCSKYLNESVKRHYAEAGAEGRADSWEENAKGAPRAMARPIVR
ncbi:hypothetical protein [Burkholderia gladioli]|uniref:hypothetical protein n=1 Tax=Burkholderia gladioli TaxID=28095 RepID=UPI00163F5FBA|nr:hypothetical protein [Burkholderia gladioli]